MAIVAMAMLSAMTSCENVLFLYFLEVERDDPGNEVDSTPRPSAPRSERSYAFPRWRPTHII